MSGYCTPGREAEGGTVSTYAQKDFEPSFLAPQLPSGAALVTYITIIRDGRDWNIATIRGRKSYTRRRWPNHDDGQHIRYSSLR